jgi:FkbM family methyltransferase
MTGLYNFLVRFLACFILNGRRRRAFKDRWLNLPQKLQSMMQPSPSIYSKLITNIPYRQILYGICEFQDPFVFKDERKYRGKDGYQKDVEELYVNLDKKAAGHLDSILRKKDKLYHHSSLLLSELYTEEELKIRKQCEHYLSETRQINHECWELDKYKLPVSLFDPTVFFHKYGLKTLKTTDTISTKAIFDIGCYVGDSALVFHEFFPDNVIYSFEPNPDYYKMAIKTIEWNNLNNVVLEPLGFGDKAEQVSMIGQSIVNGKGQCVIDTLDNYVEKHDIQVGLIKADIEGYEQKFLAGAYKTIAKQKPVLQIAIYHTYDDFFHIKPLIESWNLGYKFDFFKGIDLWSTGEIFLFCEVY